MRKAGKNPFDQMKPEEAILVQQLNIYPDSAQLSKEDWQLIVDYYVRNAPEQPLMIENTLPESKASLRFQANPLYMGDQGSSAVPKLTKTTMLKYDSLESKLYVGNAHNEIYVLDSLFQVDNYWEVVNPPVVSQSPCVVSWVSQRCSTRSARSAVIWLRCQSSAKR